MNRIFKILILVVLIPLYWGIEVGCTGPGGGASPVGGTLNGASPDGSIQTGPENRPSGQPTHEVVPRPIGEFFMALKLRTADTDLNSQCSQFASKSWQDPKTYGVLYAMKKTTDPTGTDGTYYPPVCDCDEQSGCCGKSTCYKPLNSECHTNMGAKGQCNTNHVCAVAPIITVTVKTTNPQRIYTFEVNYCPPAQEKVIDFSYDVEWDIRHDTPNTLNLDCKTEVEISAELINPVTGDKYKSPLLSGLCPRLSEGGECKVGMTLSQSQESSTPPQEIHCQYIPRHDLNVNTDAGVKQQATQ